MYIVALKKYEMRLSTFGIVIFFIMQLKKLLYKLLLYKIYYTFIYPLNGRNECIIICVKN